MPATTAARIRLEYCCCVFDITFGITIPAAWVAFSSSFLSTALASFAGAAAAAACLLRGGMIKIQIYKILQICNIIYVFSLTF
jgi:hypothetical protein